MFSSRFLLYLSMCVATFFSPFASFSQQIDTVNIDDVEITSLRPRKEDRSVVPLQTITRAQLDALPGNAVSDAVKNFSGVTVRDYGGVGGLKTVMVRSLGANHTGVFVDGIQFSDAASGQVDLGKISSDNAEVISLSVGQSSSLCQPARYYASANVINVQSIQPDFNSRKVHAKYSYKLGSFGTIKPSISTRGLLHKNIYADFSSSYSRSQGAYPFTVHYGNAVDSVKKRDNSDIESLTLQSSLSFRLPSAFIVRLSLYSYIASRGLPGAVVFYNPYASQRLWNRDYNANINVRNPSKSRIRYLSNVKFASNWLRYLDPVYHNSSGKLDNRYLQNEYYCSQAVSARIVDSLYLSLASDMFVNTLDANLPQYPSPTRYSWLNSAVASYNGRSLEVSTGLLASIVREHTQIGDAASGRNVVSPSFSLGYKIFSKPELKLRFLFKDIFRMPTFSDLYFNQVGNTSLRPEFAKQFNLGLTFVSRLGILQYISFKSDVFYNKITDKIVAIPSKNLFQWSMQNVGKVDSRGFELQVDARTRVLPKITNDFSCNYTYMKATDVTDPASSSFNQQVPYIPFETFSASTSLSYKSVTLGYGCLFNGFRYVMGQNIYQNLIRGWWVSDASISIRRSLFSTTVNLKGEVNNLFDVEYEVVKSFPMPGRAYYITLQLLL